MKSVFASANLPQGLADLRAQCVRYFNELATSVNQAAQGRLREFVSVSAAYTAGENDHVIQVAPSGTMTVTLKEPGVMRNKWVTVKRTNNTTHTITVQSAVGNIDGSASVTLTSAYQARHFFSDGAQWWTH